VKLSDLEGKLPQALMERAKGLTRLSCLRFSHSAIVTSVLLDFEDGKQHRSENLRSLNDALHFLADLRKHLVDLTPF
jgi:hypothetical protein